MRVIDNQEEYLKEISGLFPERRSHSLTFANNAEYAETLHNRQGYSVIADSRLLQFTNEWLQELVDSEHPMDVRHVGMALDGAGFETANWHRSYSNKLRPPARAGEGPRTAHPAPLNWADITNNLRQSYTHQVDNRRPKTDAHYK